MLGHPRVARRAQRLGHVRLGVLPPANGLLGETELGRGLWRAKAVVHLLEHPAGRRIVSRLAQLDAAAVEVLLAAGLRARDRLRARRQDCQARGCQTRGDDRHTRDDPRACASVHVEALGHRGIDFARTVATACDPCQHAHRIDRTGRRLVQFDRSAVCGARGGAREEGASGSRFVGTGSSAAHGFSRYISVWYICMDEEDAEHRRAPARRGEARIRRKHRYRDDPPRLGGGGPAGSLRAPEDAAGNRASSKRCPSPP